MNKIKVEIVKNVRTDTRCYMRYLGGKTRNAKWIAKEIVNNRTSGQTFIEPFCGGLSISFAVDKESTYQNKQGKMLLCDIHPGLINLYKGLQDNTFIIPDKICTQEDYQTLSKNFNAHSPYDTMIGFGLSYAGKWWGGYDNYYDKRGQLGHTWNMLVNSLSKVKKLSSAEFKCIPYQELDPVDCIIYADPPYNNTTEYKFINKFDTEEFWNIMRKWSKHNKVFISEYSAPDDFISIAETKYKVQMCTIQKEKIEKLFVHNMQEKLTVVPGRIELPSKV